MRTIFSLCVAILSLTVLGLCGCERKAKSGREPLTDEQFLREVTNFELSITGRVATLERQLDGLKFELQVLKEQVAEGGRKVILDLLAKEFSPIQTDLGMLFVKPNGAEPYLNGHKVKLDIGNPLSAPIVQFQIKCVYGLKAPEMPRNADLDLFGEYVTNRLAHTKSLRTNEVTFTDILKPATWTPVELSLVPSTAEQLGYLELSIAVVGVNLRTIPKQ